MKKGNFKRKIANFEECDKPYLQEVKGYIYEYNGIKYGIYNTNKLENEDTLLKGRRANCYISVIITENKYNGLSIANGDKLKECVENTNKIINKFYDRIIQYRDSKEI
jgi:hypothetical protein